MTDDLGICEQCETEEATHLMYPAYAQSRDINARTPTAMCDQCAKEAFESGEFESDENE